MAERRPRVDGRLTIALVLLAGLLGIVVAIVAGLVPDLLKAIAAPPPIVRAGLAGLSVVVGGWLLVAAVRLIDRSFRRDAGPAGAVSGAVSDADLGRMVRGVRFVFLSAAAFAAAGGWILGEPLPLVIALIIAGVDVVETSFLLLVASRRAS